MALLNGRVAIITGASRGIGAAIARRFAAEGANVAIVARTVEAGDSSLAGSLAETAALIQAGGGECLSIGANLADPADRSRIVAKTVAHFGRLDILVNNAAWSRFVPIWEAQPKHFHLALEMNVHAPQEQRICRRLRPMIRMIATFASIVTAMPRSTARPRLRLTG